MNRFNQSVAALFAATLSSLAWGVDGVYADRIVLGQTAGFSGPVAAGVKETSSGALAYFERINKAGGVHGRRIEVVALDDKFEPKIAGENCKTLVVERKVFALFLTRGTPHAEACLPVVETYKVPLVAPSTGAHLLHSPIKPWVFNVRAQYQDEVADAVRYFATVGLSKMALLHVDDSFGRDAREGFDRAVEKARIKPAAIVMYDRTKMDMDKAAVEIFKAEPAAIIVAGSGQAVADFVKSVRTRGSGAQIMTLSNNSSQGFVKSLGANAHGVIVSQIAPSPASGTTVMGREFKTDAKSTGGAPSYAAMEGYMAARVFVEGLKRAGNNPTRESLVVALESIRNWDMGGVVISYSPTDHTGAEFTELSIIGADGNFLR